MENQTCQKPCILKRIFYPIKALFKFINDYFKSCLFVLILFLIFSQNSANIQKANLAMLDIHGAIMDARESLEKIEKLKENDEIKGVLLHIDSPGGALAPSIELSEAIKELSLKKPVVAYASGSMTSGSYYAGIWSEKIFANPGSFIGSIGVIMQSFNIEELTNKIGIKSQIAQAGKYKQAGTFMREWNEDEKEQISSLINSSYDLFLNDVIKARNLDINNSKQFADARVFLAAQAQKVGLIDEVGTLNKAKDYLIKRANISDPIWQKPDKFEEFINKFSQESAKMLLNTLSTLRAY